jgi:hypothetical protein
MALSFIKERIMKLENQCRFLDWFVRQRFHVTLTLEEIDTYLREGVLPDPTPNRPSRLDTLDRKSLLELWEEDEQIFGGRTQEELKFYAENGFWPEQRGRLHYFLQDGKLNVDWRNDPDYGLCSRETVDEQPQVG